MRLRNAFNVSLPLRKLECIVLTTGARAGRHSIVWKNFVNAISTEGHVWAFALERLGREVENAWTFEMSLLQSPGPQANCLLSDGKYGNGP